MLNDQPQPNGTEQSSENAEENKDSNQLDLEDPDVAEALEQLSKATGQGQESPSGGFADKVKGRRPGGDTPPPQPSQEPDVPDYEGQIADLKDRLMRSIAEAENLRKRSKIEAENAGNYAITNFARDLVTVLDNLYRATEAIADEALDEAPALKNLFDGVEMTKKEFINVFDRYGIKRLDPKGELFDHNFHQAMVQIEDAEHPEGTVVQVMQPGYTIKDRLLRPAMVGVSKTPAAPVEPKEVQSPEPEGE